ncbi:Protein of unknown function [Dyella jiangningensis]|uniref:DUF3999 family protein n=1 Tax=Dyella sp. AtDHG13 TaxID=1938897 RepID=UPI00088D9215|nr:DUF3999 family protein [Dyella sp. AtDHG13]PXV61325.1 uncharacterized protein DUF3999 [Dyella sp. AtDHG13]SDJ94360.1 Protein of unknown function [Dyella jiangningensis]
MRLDVRWIALALMLPVVAARAGPNVNYAYAFPLDTKSADDAYRVVLGPQVYAAANPSAHLRDVIVVNAAGKPVPFAPMPPSPPTRHHFETMARLLPVPVAAANNSDSVKVERNANGGIVISQDDRGATAQHTDSWLIDAGRAVEIDSIALDPSTLQEDFQIHVTVEGSNDLRQWNLMSSDVGLTRVHGDQDQVEQLSIDTASSEPERYFRVRLTDGQVDWSTGHVPTVKLVGNYTDAAADRASQLQWLEPRPNGQVSGDYEYELSAELPLIAFKLTLPADNNAATVHVILDNGDETWSEVTSLNLVRAGGKGGEDTATMSQPYNTRRIHVRSDTPLAGAPALSVGWLPPQYVFIPEGSAPFRLLAGSYSARRGDYPVDEALSRLRSTKGEDWQPTLAELGPRVDEAGPSALEAPKVPYDWTKPLLWVVLALGALGVAAMAFSLLKQGRRDESKS